MNLRINRRLPLLTFPSIIPGINAGEIVLLDGQSLPRNFRSIFLPPLPPGPGQSLLVSLSLLLPPFVRPRAVLHRSDVVCVCLRAYGCSRAKNFHAVLDILTYYHVINIHSQLTYGPGIPFERSRDSTSVSI